VFAGLGLMIKLFKVVATCSRPFEVQGMAKYHIVLTTSFVLEVNVLPLGELVSISL
tara:strand:- start:44 stop:211 length:168 start_codon:yes stop_codon:yes gene_type:complete